CVEYQVENGTVIKANNFEYRKDNSDNWKKIKLLKYNSNTEGCNDYAIFYSDKVKRGFILDDDNDAPEFVISKLYDNRILINEICTDNIIEGQSGSPIFDYENEIVGILIAGLYLDYNINQFLEEDVIKSFYTRIQIVIHALTSLGS
ncbi:MAG: hypothetical protein H5T85_07790, partial [Actinobacteria bacterium]|nr:hypothetical protein [Actinomycetota bacterium]